MKKKIIAISAAIAIIAIAVVGGSLAWFTSSAEVTNTFTMGNVKISLDEAKVDEATGKMTDDGETRVRSNSYHIVPDAVLDKDPTVTVLKGSEPCLVYVLIRNTLGSYAGLDVDTVNWKAVPDTDTAGEIKYPGLYKYIGPLTQEAALTDTPLPKVFTTVTIAGAELTNEILKTLTGDEIIVKAYAIQSANIEGQNTAQMAWDAMNAPSL